MFFESRGSLIVASILLLAGCACFFLWREDSDSARRERTTVGVITDRSGGRSGTSYDYRFEIDGVAIYDESSSCRTALTPKGCKIGAPVLVYYDQNSTLRSKLKEFGVASSEDLTTGFCMVFGGLLITVLHFLFKRALDSPDESDDIDIDRPDQGPETIHVVPGE